MHTVNSFLDDFEQLVAEISVAKERLLILGDFNIHVDRDLPEVRRFNDILHAHNLSQLVTSPTHKRGHTLDLVVVRDGDSIVSDVTVCNYELSDHFTVGMALSLSKVNVELVKSYRKYRSITPGEFGRKICDEFAECEATISVNEMAENFDMAIMTTLDQYAPLKKQRFTPRPKNPWFNEEIALARNHRRQLERKWFSSKLEVHRQMFVAQRDCVANLIRNAKKDYYEERLSTGDLKETFNVIKELTNDSDCHLPSGDPVIVANKFATFFSDKISKIRTNLDNEVSTYAPSGPSEQAFLGTPLECFTPATEDEIKRIISSMATKSCELDPIPTWLLKKCLGDLLPILTLVVNESMSSGTFPECYKKARVRPLLKKPSLDPEILSNYRPVSNIPFLSKVVEKVVSKRLSDHFDTNGLFDPMQSAYRAKHSTETALLKVHNDIVHAMDSNKAVLFVALDLSAAFDTLDHPILLKRLEVRFGVSGSALEWFKSYLTGRSQEVTVKDAVSDMVPLRFGVPQGSVLGPLLFTAYNSPLGDIIRSFLLPYVLYADDSGLYIIFDPKNPMEVQNVISRLTLCVESIKEWMVRNKLKLNDSKTEFFLACVKNLQKYVSELKLKIGDTVIELSDSIKLLGVTFDREMSMKAHVNNVCRAANFHLYRLGKIRPLLSQSAATSAVRTLVVSRLDYANSLLYNISEANVRKLQLVQNSAARLVTRVSRREHITPVLRSLHWLPLRARLEYKIVLMVFKCLHEYAPQYLADCLKVYQPTRSLRSSAMGLCKEVRTRRVIGSSAFSVAGPKLWNQLPNSIRDKATLTHFKTALKTYIFKKYL